MDPVDEPEARVVVVGEGVDDNEALFTGSLADAKDFVRALAPDQQGASTLRARFSGCSA